MKIAYKHILQTGGIYPIIKRTLQRVYMETIKKIII